MGSFRALLIARHIIGGWGCETNREIDFGFVSCSCRACVHACEAVRVRETMRPHIAGPADGTFPVSRVG